MRVSHLSPAARNRQENLGRPLPLRANISETGLVLLINEQ